MAVERDGDQGSAPRLLNIGYGNFVPVRRIISIIRPDSAPVKRLKDFARKKGKLVDATFGRKTRSIIVTDSNHVILSALQPETNAQRYLGNTTILDGVPDSDEAETNESFQEEENQPAG